MHTKYTLVAVDHDCPADTNETNCPLRDWLKTQTLFQINGTELKPVEPLFRLARAPYIMAIEHINQLCYKCKSKER